MPQPITEPALSIQDLEQLLDDEISKLADKYRLALVQCDLQGRAPKQVARELRIPEGTLYTRLARARRMLAQRLRCRGVTLSAAAVGTMLGGNAALAGVPLPLASSTVKASMSVAAGATATSSVVSAKVAFLAEGVLKAMLLTKLKVPLGMLLAASVLAFGLAMFAPPSLVTAQTAAEKPKSRQAVAKDQQAATQAEAPMRWKQRLRIDQNYPEDGQVRNAAISPDGKKIVVARGAKEAKVLDAATGQEVATLGTNAALAVAFSPDSNLFAQTDEQGYVELCAADSGEAKAKLEKKGVRCVAFSPKGKTLATGYGGYGGDDAGVQLWDLASNKVIREFIKFPTGQDVGSHVWSLAFSADGKKLAAALGSENVAKVWDVETGKELATFGKQSNWVIAVAISPDGNTMAAATQDEVKLWDVATGKERFTLKGPTAPYNGLAFSPDGRILAVAAQEDKKDEKIYTNVVRLWNPATGKQDGVLEWEVGYNWAAIGFARDGTLVTSGGDGVRIWEPERQPAAKKN